MGTTLTAIQNGGADLCFVLAIEGYVNLIHDGGGGATDAAVVTAWAATQYAAALGGLARPGTITQSIEPFRPKIEANSTTFVVYPDPDPATGLAVDVFTTDPATGVVATLNPTNGILNPTDTTLTWDTAVDLSAGGGTIYLGTERTTYTGTSGATSTGHTRGTPVPFANGNTGTTWARQHRLSVVAGVPVTDVIGRDYPGRGFIGKYVGCWAHRVVDGVLDVKAQAELIFAGRIADIRETTDGTLQLVCEDIRGTVRNAVLMGDQFTCKPAEGTYLTSEDGVQVRFYSTDLTTPSIDDRDWIIGTDDTAGFYTADEIIGLLQAWCAGDGFTNTVTLYRTADDRVRWRASSAASTHVLGKLRVTMSVKIAGMLGFDIEAPNGYNDGGDYSWITHSAPFYERVVNQTAGVMTIAITGSLVTAYGTAFPSFKLYGGAQTMDAQNGTWIDQAADLPEPWGSYSTSDSTKPNTQSGSWGFLKFQDYVFLAQDNNGDGTAFDLWGDKALDAAFGTGNPYDASAHQNPWAAGNEGFIRKGQPVPEFKQIIVIQDTLDYIVSRIFYSTGDAGYNHATYDAWDYQLSCDGGIPGDLLGTNFINSLTNLAAAADSTMTLFLEKPTRLEQVLLPELVLRGAHLVISYGTNAGGLAFVSPSTPTVANATHTLTTSHRATLVGEGPDLPDWELSRNTLITDIKAKYNRTLRGDYRDDIQINNAQTKTDYGGGEPITIEARNNIALDANVDTGDGIRALLATLAGDALAYYNRPRPIATRAVAASQWPLTPGDTASLTDDWLRSTATGQRGISEVPCWLIAVSQNWQKMIADVSFVLHGDDAARRVIYSPVATVDHTAGTDSGYTHAGPYIHLLERDFAIASESEDGASLEDGDLVRIIERSPVTPGSPSTFDRTLSGNYDSTNNRITLTSALPASNSLNGAKWYVVSQLRSSAQASQQTDCYLGDDVDGYIEDSVKSRLYAHQAFTSLGVEAAVQTDLHEYPPTDGNWHTEGRPVHPMMHRAGVYSVNNLIGYRTAPELPMLFDVNTPFTTTSPTYVLACYPVLYYVGRGVSNVYTRVLSLGPAMKQTTGGSGRLRVTSSKYMPVTSDTGIGSSLSVSFLGPINQQEWTNTALTYTNVAAKTITPILWPGGTYTWLTVELLTSANTAGFYGFHRTKLGPLV